MSGQPNPLDVLREALRVPPEGHRRLCATREPGNAECDCFMRFYTPALDALAQVETLMEAANEVVVALDTPHERDDGWDDPDTGEWVSVPARAVGRAA